MGRRLVYLLILVLAGIGAVALAVGIRFMSGGISARQKPDRIEQAVARRLRAAAIPSDVRSSQNPVPATPEVIASAMMHFADHCAVCHANNGSGETDVGQGLYPRVPDMRKSPTQSLSDGSLFYIIEHGVRLTGMPAWGDGSHESERASWDLVRFIRHLPALTDDELEKMKAANPKSSDEWKEEEESRQFLEGGQAPTSPPAHHHGGER
jgi:mono/diheme cytochrome c family protein